MDAVNLRTMVNLTGGSGEDLATTIANFDRAFPAPVRDDDRADLDPRERARLRRVAGRRDRQGEGGGRGGPEGPQDAGTVSPRRRSDGQAGARGRSAVRSDVGGVRRAGLPVAMHVGDPEAFFLPIDRFNERYEELNAHPDWSFHGKDFPAFQEILERPRSSLRQAPEDDVRGPARRPLGREPAKRSARCSTSFRNVHVEIGARIGELGRQPRTSARFFDKYQDRILFGTDAIPLGTETPQQVFGEDLYRIYYRFLETEDEYFDYAPARVPPQGRWRIYGLGLPEPILRKVYYENARARPRVEAGRGHRSVTMRPEVRKRR